MSKPGFNIEEDCKADLYFWCINSDPSWVWQCCKSARSVEYSFNSWVTFLLAEVLIFICPCTFMCLLWSYLVYSGLPRITLLSETFHLIIPSSCVCLSGVSPQKTCLMLIILTSPLILCVSGCPCGWPRGWRPWWLCTWLSGQTLPRAVQWTFPEGPGASTRSVKMHRTILYISNLTFIVVLCSLLCGRSKRHVFMLESKHHTHTVYQPLVCMSGC